jgi:hypothetical protein
MAGNFFVPLKEKVIGNFFSGPEVSSRAQAPARKKVEGSQSESSKVTDFFRAKVFELSEGGSGAQCYKSPKSVSSGTEATCFQQIISSK